MRLVPDNSRNRENEPFEIRSLPIRPQEGAPHVQRICQVNSGVQHRRLFVQNEVSHSRLHSNCPFIEQIGIVGRFLLELPKTGRGGYCAWALFSAGNIFRSHVIRGENPDRTASGMDSLSVWSSFAARRFPW